MFYYCDLNPTAGCIWSLASTSIGGVLRRVTSNLDRNSMILLSRLALPMRSGRVVHVHVARAGWLTRNHRPFIAALGRCPPTWTWEGGLGGWGDRW